VITFYRDQLVKTGAPDGGDGGKGGDIVLRSTSFFKDLRIFKSPEIIGNTGKSG